MVSLVITENIDGIAETGLAPLKLFESLACGVPVIVSDQPGMGDLVRKAGCGLIVPERNPAALALAMAKIAADPARISALGRTAREEALARCSWDARAIELQNMLDRLKPLSETKGAS
jgi:glycosyltransferase involved in cell wall biosynthesis